MLRGVLMGGSSEEECSKSETALPPIIEPSLSTPMCIFPTLTFSHSSTEQRHMHVVSRMALYLCHHSPVGCQDKQDGSLRHLLPTSAEDWITYQKLYSTASKTVAPLAHSPPSLQTDGKRLSSCTLGTW